MSHSTAQANTGGDTDDSTEATPLIRTQTSIAVSDSSSARLFLLETSPKRFWVIFSQILTVQFIGCFDGTIMSSSHPAITSYFGVANSASWLSTAFLLTSTAFQPVLGRLSDALGRKPLFIGCLGVFAIATTWCAVAGNFQSFVAARAICGLGAGGSMTLGSIITSDMVPIERRGSYQPYNNIMYGVGCALGAALGGAMAETMGWRWEFGVQVPLLLLCFGISLVAIPDDISLHRRSKSLAEAAKNFDAIGSVLLTTSTTVLILSLNLAGNVLPWSHPSIIVFLTLFAICFPAFIWIESRVAQPIMPLQLIWHRPRANLIFSNFIAAMLTNSVLFNMPLYFQAVLLSSPTKSGLRLVLPSVISSATAAMTGFTISWTRRLKWPFYCGSLCYLLGTFPLCFLQRGITSILFVLILVPSSMGQGFQFPGTFIAILATSAQSEQAVVTSALLLWRSLGMVLGVTISSLVVQNALMHYLDVFVRGEQRDEVITLVRASVEAIVRLEPPYREQVVQSYEAALRLLFTCCTAMAILLLLLILPIKLPRLASRV